jgi:phospholipase C
VSVSRRDALKGLGGLAGTAAMSGLLPSCSKTPPSTMVFMMMENRTYDHFLGARAMLEGLPGDGLTMDMTNPDASGNPVGLSVPPVTPAGLCVLDPPHEWDPSRVQFNSGANDGFVRAFQMAHPGTDGSVVMEYMTRQHLPGFWALADAYTSCDRWFASVLGPTLPNRMFWLAGQSNGAKDNLTIIGGAYMGVTTIFDRLDAAGIDWAYYYGDFGVLSFFPQFANDNRIQTYPYFLEAAAAGKLPPVVFIDPSYTYNDYHPPHYPLVAEQLVASTYQALATSPQWSESLFVLTFDEHGGFHDHVPPGPTVDDRADQGFDQLGFRVPALVIGPKVAPNRVVSTPYQHTSALKHIENVFGLQPLMMRDAASTDLTDCILPTMKPTAPITLPTVEVDESMLDDCIGKAFDEHVVIGWARKLGIDVTQRQKIALDGVYRIAEYLDQHGLGRIRRGR